MRRQRPSLVYLDNNQWNYLVEPPDPPRGLRVDVVRRAISDGVIQVVGSVDLLEELLGTWRSNPAKYERMRELFEKFVGRRMLRPLEQRHPMEVRHGGLLPVRKRYLGAPDRRGLIDLSVDDEALTVIIANLEARKDDYLDDQLRRRDDVQTAVAQAGEALSLDALRRWYENADIEGEWVADAVQSGADRGLYDMPEGTDYSSRRYPSSWTFVHYNLVRLVYTVGASRKIMRSDLADGYHVASAPYVDVLVSDDQRMREAVELMPERPKVLDSATFDALLRTCPGL